MIDANGAFTLPDAMQLAHALEPLGIAWFEEPVHCDQPALHAQLRAKTSIPVALGESLYSKFEFADYVEQGAVDILQPDAGRIGVTEWMKVAHMAECWGLPVAPHAFFELHAQLVAACRHGGPVHRMKSDAERLTSPLRMIWNSMVDVFALRLPST